MYGCIQFVNSTCYLQCDALKYRTEELEAELEILKEEMAVGVGDGGVIAVRGFRFSHLSFIDFILFVFKRLFVFCSK